MMAALAFGMATVSSQAVGWPHTFEFIADRDLHSVSVAGTFNNWSATANPMRREGSRWSATVDLPWGRQLYKFVLDGSMWIVDPKNPNTDTDESGNRNSVIVGEPREYEFTARKGDGKLTQSPLYHSGSAPYFCYDRGNAVIRLRLRPNDVDSVAVVVNGKRLPMSLEARNELFAMYRADYAWTSQKTLHYSFVLRDGGREWAYGVGGVEAQPTASREFTQRPSAKRALVAPKWPEKVVVYEIFPDRFADGDKSNDPKGVLPWNASSSDWSWLGGDAAGVEQHLSYLKDLGVGAVYFTPVFESPVYHRYETQDYLKIDPRFGTNQEFERLTRDLARNGIRTVIDGVFNHTAREFGPFADVVKHGAESKFKRWYTVYSYPVRLQGPPNYLCWNGFGSMPKLNYSSADVRHYVLNVAKTWDRWADIAGWRLDAADEVALGFWPSFRSAVKQNNSERWIVGEIWGDGGRWLAGNMFDSVMGYQFRTATLDFIARGTIGPSEYADRLMWTYANYAPQVDRQLMNLLDSHDTPRFLTDCHGDESLAKLGAVLQLTWPGSPCVYYGDELGMAGGGDPANRQGMAWNTVPHNPTLAFYKKLIHLRNAAPALQSGEPVILSADDKARTLAYARVLKPHFCVVLVNRSSSTRTVTLSPQDLARAGATHRNRNLYDLLNGRRYSVTQGASLVVSLQPQSACVLASEEAISSTSSRTAWPRRPVTSHHAHQQGESNHHA